MEDKPSDVDSGRVDSKTNVLSAPIPPGADVPPGLQEIYNALEKKAQQVMKWYESRQRSKKRGARITRATAVLLGAATTIIPSVIAFFPEHLTWWIFSGFPIVKLNPIATITGVLAATMILMDKFYGFSSSWMRFVTTYQEIQSNLDDFRINWRKQILKLNSNQPPTDEQIIAVYDFLGGFLKSINDAVRNETQSWVNEFKSTLADIDKTVEAQKTAAAALTSAAPKKGAINVSVLDYNDLDDRRWTLQLDNRKEEPKVGQSSAAIPSLDPGIYKLRVAGRRKQQEVAAEYSVQVKPGEVSKVEAAKLG